VSEVVRVPFLDGFIETVLVDGEPHVVLKSAVEGMGLGWEPQRKKLARRSWGVTSQREATGADGKTYEMVTCDLETWSMLLANIDENKVSEAARSLVIEYQKKSAKALREFWTQGGAINPAATDEQLAELQEKVSYERRLRTLELAGAEIRLLKMLEGYASPTWLTEELLARADAGLGRERQVPVTDRTLMIESFLAEKGLTRRDAERYRSAFGRRLKALYVLEHGAEPPKDVRRVNGRDIPTFVYYERDRPLMEHVWSEYYAERMGGAA